MLQILLLAAGASRRFGSNKLLAPLTPDQTLLDLSYHAAAQLHGDPLLIISEDKALRAHCERAAYRYVINPRADEGMASSIVCGIRTTPEAPGWAICLADMPCQRAQTMQQLCAAWDGTHIVQPRYRQQPGHPVLFPRAYYAQLLALEGDQGARRIVQYNRSKVIYLDLDDPGVLLDIDTPADMQQLEDLLDNA